MLPPGSWFPLIELIMLSVVILYREPFEWKGSVWFDVLIKIGCFVKKKKCSFIVKSSCYELIVHGGRPYCSYPFNRHSSVTVTSFCYLLIKSERTWRKSKHTSLFWCNACKKKEKSWITLKLGHERIGWSDQQLIAFLLVL